MTVHMWNDEQVTVFCDDDSDDPLDFVTRERVDDVTCHACLRAAIEFGERCSRRMDLLCLDVPNMVKMTADAIEKRGKA